MSKRFDKNLEKWAVRAPKEALMLPFFEAKNCTPVLTEAGEPNLLIGKTPLHNTQNAAEEALEWVKTIQFQNCELCFVYGVGLGYSYMALRPWLRKNKKRMVVFLEDDLSVIKYFMETEIASKMLKDPQARLHFVSSLSQEDPFFKTLYWNFALTPLVITSIPSYKKMKPKRFEELSHCISFTNAYHNAMVDEYVNFGGPFFFNFYQNLLKLPLACEGNKFFGKFKNVPAIICGAGPSLGKHMKSISGLSKRALIFGCGSAMNALNAAGILPHFGAAIDPNVTQSERLKANSAKDVPYFYRNRVHPVALDLVKGPRLYISGCGGYDLNDWFEDKLKIRRQELDEGYNVVNLSIEIARQLGCNPIITVGCDLAFTGMKSYAEGVESNVAVTVSQITTNEDFDQQAILENDIYGNPTYTMWKWIAEAEWIGQFAKKNDRLKVLNATEGGIGFPEVPNVTLQECVGTYLQVDYDLQDRIRELVEKTSLSHLSKEKIVKLMLELTESFERCEGFLTTLVEEGKTAIKLATETKQMPASLQSGAFALAEFELSEEPAYTYLLSNFNSVFSMLLSREYETIRNQMPRTPDWKKYVKSIEINNKKFFFLRNTCRANREIIRWVLAK